MNGHCDFCPRPGRLALCSCENGHQGVGVWVCAEKHEPWLGSIEIACRPCYEATPQQVVALHEGDLIAEAHATAGDPPPEEAMTDKERLLAFLDGAGYARTDATSQYSLMDERAYYEDGPTERKWPPVTSASGIVIGSGIGYGGFYAEFLFDENEKLINHGCWE